MWFVKINLVDSIQYWILLSLRSLLRYRGSKPHMANPDSHSFIILENYREHILYDSGIDDTERIIAIGDKELMLE